MTDLIRQNRRLNRLRDRGITRTTLMVHNDARNVLDSLRPAFVDPNRALELLKLWNETVNNRQPTNVSKVQHISPWRYPGGKTWLVPEIRAWLQSLPSTNRFVEPFAGGASCGLMVANEGLARQVVLGELDKNVSAVWELIINGSDSDADWLCERIRTMEVSLESVQLVLRAAPRSLRELAFQTLLQNRCARGGILAPGAGLTKTGEAGRGIQSRWYPETLIARIELIRTLRDSLRFCQGDAFELIEQFKAQKRAVFFIDPPYTIGKKQAGSRLYLESQVDHERLFRTCASVAGATMMTYPEDPDVIRLARKYGYLVNRVPMRSTHHTLHKELVLTKV